MMNPTNRILASLALASAGLLAALPAHAQAPLKIEGAWVRATVPGQSGTGGFMTITASEPLSLVGVASPVAGVGEVHEMKMEGDVMKMRAMPALELPAGKPVELKPGGYHVMLLDLKAPLAKDTVVPITLVFKDSKGAESKLELKVPVSATVPAQAGAAAMMDGHKH